MINSTKVKYAATLLGAFAVLAIAPATAFAADNDDSGPGGCFHTDSNGDSIPIHNGEDVFVDGKIVSCRNGEIIITTPPQRGGVQGLRPQLDGKLPVLAEASPTTKPAKPPRLPAVDAPILIATP